jgi:1,4-alpha-glucan branching enzyme
MHPGKKLLFMGGEFAQWDEWSHDQSLQWHLTQWERHNGIQKLVADLNTIYRNTPSLYEYDFDPKGFEWIDCNDWENSILTFIRKGSNPDDIILIGCNFTPVPRLAYRVGVPLPGYWEEILNSDAIEYGGSGSGNAGGTTSEAVSWHGKKNSILITLPPLAAVVFKFRPEKKNQ